MYGIREGKQPMSLGLAKRQGNLLNDMEQFCDRALADRSIYAVLHRERDRLFPDGAFADLFAHNGRRSVPPSVVATVMVLQRLEGLSDREAVDRYAFDTRWRYAAGVGSYDCGGWASFAHTVLVDMRSRLAASKDPRRIFDVTVQAAGAAGLLGAKRVLDSTPLYDSVATMDTITLIRSAIRGLLKVADIELGQQMRALLSSGDDYQSNAKPQIDWDDEAEREALVDFRAKDGFALLFHLDGQHLEAAVTEAAALLATVLGQDLDETEDGTFRIARRVAPDRVISTVDPEARHGHKTAAHGFDGYKGHISEDPDSELITATTVTPGNVADGAVATELVKELIDHEPAGHEPAGHKPGEHGGPIPDSATVDDAPAQSKERAPDGPPRADQAKADQAKAVYGDNAYGTGEVLEHLNGASIDARVKTPAPHAPNGHFTKDDFEVNLENDTVTCPSGVTVAISWGRRDGVARFADACTGCALRNRCTSSTRGRSINVGYYEAELAENRRRQKEPDRAADYRATRPKVERKLGHLMRRRHGGRRARVRGLSRVAADFSLLAAAHNLARLGVLGLHWNNQYGWQAT